MNRYVAIFYAATFVFLLAGCSSTQTVTSETAPGNSDTEQTDRLEDIYWARQDSARNVFSQADVDFMTGMISHHAQALVMSNMAPTHADSRAVKTLAARIINAQKDEIETMQTWLRERDQTVPEVHIEGTKLMMHGAGDHAMHMPGMLTQSQIDELNAARGPEFDRLFLTYMIQHHGGAVTMVKELFRQDGAGQGDVAFKLASDIHVDQVTEIARMENMLARMFPESSQD